MYCGLFLDQHMLKEFLPFKSTNKFVGTVTYPSKITTIGKKVQGMLPQVFLALDLVLTKKFITSHFAFFNLIFVFIIKA